ncbi:MAG: 30S ribosomal protein S12 methylthiotransferase RimO [Bacteroidia bacterium]|nr:30S ribosomal protein S12 methylthiotransferase RimO [Bacteroidia bacterium]
MIPVRVDIINLGCSKNLVDSEKLLSQLRSQGIITRLDPGRVNADVLVINTCGFILDAKEESVNTILEAIEAKRNGQISKIYAMGCLIQRYRNELVPEMPEVDAWFGVEQIPDIVNSLNVNFNPEILNQRLSSTPAHYAYLKVSEGCSRNCSFCAIPNIRGKHVSRKMEDIQEEATWLAKKGVRELLLIAQDLSFYGRDLYRKSMLVPLLISLSEIEGISWIRLHYAYPESFPAGLLDLMHSNDKICNYLDIPFQHISNRMLKMMNRGYSKADTYKLIREIRDKMPDAAIRTTFLVGHPGETEEDFLELLDFVKEARFERLGVFTYSPEEGTRSGDLLPDDVPEEIKQERYSRIMELQQQISAELNLSRVGQVFQVIIDRIDGEFLVARSRYDSPEVDQEILIPVSSGKAEPGEFHQVIITKADDYDLYADLTDANMPDANMPDANMPDANMRPYKY